MESILTKTLRGELLLSTGCTEPIAIAWASAICKRVLNDIPDMVEVKLSKNVMKNAYSVVIPQTGNLTGIKSAVAAGIVSGDYTAELEVLNRVPQYKIKDIKAFLNKNSIKVVCNDEAFIFDIYIRAVRGKNEASVHIIHNHTNVDEVTKNRQVVYKAKGIYEERSHHSITIKEAIELADTVNLAEIINLLDLQIKCNMNLAYKGLDGKFGFGIGKTLWEESKTIKEKVIALTVSGIDARMGGCPLPAMIICGSGNQGITVSVPIVVYAKEKGVSREKLMKALIIGDLIAIHIKEGIGCVSSFCGAVCASAAAVAGIAYLHDDSFQVICSTIINTLGIMSGCICDGAKGSCAAKVLACLEAGFRGWEMAREKIELTNQGVIDKDVEKTIKKVAYIANEGMKYIDDILIQMILKENL